MWRRVVVLVALVAALAGCASGPPPPPRETDLRPPATGLFADLWLPAEPGPPGPAVLVLGGSEGGLREPDRQARMLAEQGRPALALAYFGLAGLPTDLQRIPLETVDRALHVLAGEPGVDPSRLVVWGMSRGSEAALLTAADDPALVDAVVADSPSSVVNAGYPAVTEPSWTRGGVPVPFAPLADFGNPAPPDAPAAVIPVERIRGPILTLCGGADRLWPSCAYAAAIAARADTRAGRPPVTALVAPDAGHGYLEIAAEAAGTARATSTSPIPRFGGSVAADTAAADVDRPRLLAFLARL